ncbi:MAG: chromate transporter [Oscillospiraceae bacterium]|nr:chromate transporter [Oscillospiraceae bacterium]
MKNASSTNKYWELFSTFFKIGAFTFGGGYAMIPLIQRETVENHEWISEEDMMNMVAIAESTPGVLAVNSATFVGCRVAGFWGAVCATFGVVLPSFVLICILSLFYLSFLQNKWVAAAFSGIRCAVVLLMANAVVKLSKQVEFSFIYILLAVLAFVLAVFTNIDTILILIAAGVIGVFYATWKKNSTDRKEA